MKRMLSVDLAVWKNSPYRKPLILRGARQVGKTHIVREFACSFKYFVEVNFEVLPQAKAIFEKELEPAVLIRDLSILMDQPIIPGETLLFLDEIQEVPLAINALRYFYEKLPELHVIGAGSLLEFALEQIGLPVGRVEFLYMYPMNLVEFMAANDAVAALRWLVAEPFSTVSTPVHDKMMTLFSHYLAIGGMPEAVLRWQNSQDLSLVQNVHRQLLDGFMQDFSKYAKRSKLKYIDLLFKSIPQQLGHRFIYQHIGVEYRKRELAPCFDLLEKAGVVHRVYASSGQGLPLGARTSVDTFKPLFLDHALAQTLLGLSLKDWILESEAALINKGNIVEAMIGQELLALSDPRFKEQLYYWHRMERSSNAEVDYMIQLQQKIIPIEVKSGHAGHLKSLRQFLQKYTHTPYGLRFCQEQYSEYDRIKTYPLYALSAASDEMKQRVKKFITILE